MNTWYAARWIVAGVGLLVATAGCSQNLPSYDEPTSWYEESKEYTRQRDQRIAELQLQGLNYTNASRAVDLETAIRHTERPPMPAEEAAELKRMTEAALRQ